MSENSPSSESLPAANRAKAEAMRAAGLDPYPGTVERTHTTAEAVAQADALRESGTEITVCGRCGPIRLMGKAAFFHLADQSGRLQVYLKKNIAGDEAWQQFAAYLEFCDFVQVTGPLFRTKTGEITLECRRWRMLAKTIRHLPKEHFGLRDREARIRRRHADLAANPEVRALFTARSKIISAMRRWLEDGSHAFGGYLEIETPVMHAIPGGAMARPFITRHNALGLDLYLRIALELHHKRCVVGGFERVYEIGRIFRNEGISTRHNPEFTMMELYTAYVDVRHSEDLTESLIRHVAETVIGSTALPWGDHTVDLGPRFRRVPLCDLLTEACGQNVHPAMDAGEIRRRLGPVAPPRHEVAAEVHGEPGHLLLEAFEHHLEHTLIQPTFVTEFPKSVSPLAKAKPDDPHVAERSELYIGGLEIAPMYTELNDPAEQRRRFEDQMRARAAGDEEAMRMDLDFLDALEHGMPPTSGLGLGVDRLVMLLTNQQSIRDVILFPLMRPETGSSEG
ncbi:MAG: lysine--tRNA ligase [Candidatus Sumerlaeia bacterium]|nr:lysine--tRNA ligase [Candidatus Sumerlaeia bacterium]